MALVKIQSVNIGEKSVFVAEEPIGHLATVYISGVKKVKEGTSDNQAQVAGVAIGGVASGKLVHVITHGIVSGVKCASSVSLGEIVTIANQSGCGVASGLVSGKGMITPFPSITPAGSITGLVSGNIAAPTISLVSGAAAAFVSGVWGPANIVAYDAASLAGLSGIMTGITGVQAPAFYSGALAGSFTGTAFNTARVLGKALMSGGLGSSIQIFVTLGG